MDENNIIISKKLILRIFKEIREVINRYLFIQYRSETFGDSNNSEYYSVDESLFGHKNNSQIWILGAINNSTKDFRLEGVLNRDTHNLKKFITNYIPIGNKVVTDSWSGYNFLDMPNSGYIHLKHNHRGGQFGLGLESTSHIESLWAILKQKIKSTYNVIPFKNIFHFIREAEYKYKIRAKSSDDKLTDFFECCKLILDLKYEEFNKSDFVTDSDDELDLNEDF